MTYSPACLYLAAGKNPENLADAIYLMYGHLVHMQKSLISLTPNLSFLEFVLSGATSPVCVPRTPSPAAAGKACSLLMAQRMRSMESDINYQRRSLGAWPNFAAYRCP